LGFGISPWALFLDNRFVGDVREIKLDGKRVLVVGMARTGIATAKFLKARGSVVSTTEAKPEVEMREAIEELKGMDLSTEWGDTKPRPFSNRI